MNYWLVKTEPEAYSWQNLIDSGKAIWDGVRNYQARNNLMQMKTDDRVLIYHSVSEKQVVGVAKVKREHYPDPTADDSRWVVVELEPEKELTKPVTLTAIKNDERLADTALIRHTRLSVMPLEKEEFDVIIELGEDYK